MTLLFKLQIILKRTREEWEIFASQSLLFWFCLYFAYWEPSQRSSEANLSRFKFRKCPRKFVFALYWKFSSFEEKVKEEEMSPTIVVIRKIGWSIRLFIRGSSRFFAPNFGLIIWLVIRKVKLYRLI